MQAVTHSATKAAKIELGRILDVNAAKYTVAVATQFSKKPQTGISYATPYQHHVNGEGILFVPEVGSLCWVCFPSDGNRPFVLAWSSPQEEDDFRSRKPDLNPGDIYLGTRDENFLVLRRGGVVQIGGGPLNQRIFLPVNNTIKDFCENYGLHTLGGDLEWTIKREEGTTDGKRPALFSLLAREYANDPSPVAELLIGSHEGDSETILSLLVKASGQDGAAQKVELKFKKNGSVEWVVRQDVQWDVDGKFNLNVKGDISVDGKGKVALAAATELSLDGSNVKINGKTAVDVMAPTVNLKTMVNVGGAAFPVVLATPDLLLWLTMHTHKVVAPGLNTGPAYMGPPAAPPPGPPLVPAGLISKNLKST